MAIKVYVDGREGTTGLEVRDVLDFRLELEMLSLDDRFRKDVTAKREVFDEADVVFLCLPDDAAIEAVNMGSDTRFIDASTAHRVSDGWVYGLPELGKSQRTAIANAQRVSNPGCYPTGFILAVRPLVDEGVIDTELAVNAHAVSGYSGGGRKLISKYRDSLESRLDTQLYGLTLQHKHVPEMQLFSGLSRPPVFVPSVGPFYRGMLVCVAFHTVQLRRRKSPLDIVDLYQETYRDDPFVNVRFGDQEGLLTDGFLAASRCNHSNNVELCVFGHDEQVLVVACLDNLGKGAAKAAVQNMNLMFGMDETTGLIV